MHSVGGRIATSQSDFGLSWRSANNKIFGREEEIEQIDQLLLSLKKKDGSSTSSSSSSALLEIRGKAGSGKSSLIRHYPWKEKGWLLCSGKFDINKTAEPYSAGIEAIDELIEQWVLLEEQKQEREELNRILEEDDEEEEEKEQHSDNQKPSSNLEKFRELIKKDAHLDILQNTIPRSLVLAGVMTQRESKMLGERRSLSFCTDGGGEGFICPFALKAVFHRIMSFLCSTRRVVFFLDDLQWADEASLDMMKSMIKSETLVQGEDGGLLVAVAYREEDVNESHKATACLQDIKNNGVTAETIHVKDLEIQSLNALVAHLVQYEPEETMALTRVIHQKTAGNPFFVLQFLTLLQYEKFLEYNFIKFQWEWGEVQKIQTLANISDNVADVVAATIHRLPEETQVVLQVASCLGRKVVPVDVLEAYFAFLMSLPRRPDNDDISVEILKKLTQEGGMEMALENAIANGILTECDGSFSAPTDKAIDKHNSVFNNKKWSHDRLSQCSYDLIPTKLLPFWHLRLGKLLWTMSKSPMGQEWMVFTAADQMNRFYDLNKGNDSHDNENCSNKIDVARLNLEAANLSMIKAALFPAMDMLRSASRYLLEYGQQENNANILWNEENYEMSLEIFSRLAEIGVKIGQHEDAMKAVEQVEANARCIDDKYHAHCAMLTTITSGNNRDYDLGIEKGIEILRMYGQYLPRRFFRVHLFLEKQKLKRKLPDGNLEAILELPEMFDARAAKVTKLLLQYVGHYATLSEKYRMIRPLSALRSLTIACKHGLNESATSVVLFYALDLKLEGQYKEALKYAKFAIALADKFPQRMGSQQSQMRVLSVTGIFDAVISQGTNLETLLEAHEIGLKIADTEHAVMSVMAYCWSYLSVGLPIGPLQSDLVRYLKEAETLKVAYSVIVQFKIWQQTILNLQKEEIEEEAESYLEEERSERLSTTFLIGDAMNQHAELKKLDGGGVKMTSRDINTARLMLACIYNDLDTAQEMVDSLVEHMMKFDIFVSRAYFRTSYLGFAAFALVRKYSSNKKIKKRYKKLGKWALKYFQNETSRGSVNAFPILTMLQAEKSPSKEGYEHATRTCARLGLSHHEAYMCERAGEYFLNMNDQEWAKTYLDRALSLYKDWGAKGKANAISVQYKHILTPIRHVRPSHNTALKGRRRFTRGHSRLLKSITGVVSFRGASLFGGGSNHGKSKVPIDNVTLESSFR